MLLSLGLKHLMKAESCFQMMSQMKDKELSVPLELVLIVHELPDGELGKDTEDSLVVVSDTGCKLAGESLGDGCGSLRSECLSLFTCVCFKRQKQIWVTHIQFEIPPVSSRGVTSGLPSWWYTHSAAHRVVLKPGLLGFSAWLDPPA